MSNEDTVNEKKETEEEYSENCDGIGTRSYNLLQIEHEICRQQVYDLKRKLRLNESMLREVQESNESLERSLEQQIFEKGRAILQEEERHRVLAQHYQEVIMNLERKVAEQVDKIEELRERVADRSAETERLVHAETRFREAAETGETDNASLKNRNEQLLSSLQKERKKYQSAEETIEQLQNRCDHFESCCRDVKQQLDEKNEALEEARAELALRRAEAAAALSSSLEPDPSRESRKGNSLFAEVEDRRRNAISKMNDLREKYTELKRICKSQISQIKTLRAERVMTLRKWQSDTDCAFAENEQLLQNYRNRISDLESQLKSEMKKTDDSKRTVADYGDASFGYLLSLLDAKKKQTDQLAIKVEDLCTKLLIQEETTMNVNRQLHCWRRKASSLEAEICAMQAELKLAEVADDAEREILRADNQPTTEGKHCAKRHETAAAHPTFESKSIQSTNGRESEQEGSNSASENKISGGEKLVRFVENTKTEMENSERPRRASVKPAADAKYPIVYVP